MEAIPQQFPLMKVLQEETIILLETDCCCESEVATRLIHLTSGSALAALSCLYHLAAAIIKVPVVIINITIGMVPTGYKKRLGDCFPKGFGLKDLAGHIYRAVFFALDIVICPVLGAISPKANIAFHLCFGILTPNSSSKAIPEPPTLSDSNATSNSLQMVKLKNPSMTEGKDFVEQLQKSANRIIGPREYEDLTEESEDAGFGSAREEVVQKAPAKKVVKSVTEIFSGLRQSMADSGKSLAKNQNTDTENWDD